MQCPLPAMSVASASVSSKSESPSLEAVFARLRATHDVFLLDGGTGEELFKFIPDDRRLWSAAALVDPRHHAVLESVHRSFLNNGCDAVTTNSYGVIPGVGFNEDEIACHLDVAGRIARRAATCTDHPGGGRGGGGLGGPFVLGSLGPLVESYRPDMVLPHDEGVRWYERACTALAPHVDAYIGETFSCVREALQLVDSVINVSKEDVRRRRPLLVSFTLSPGGTLRDSESVNSGIRTLLTKVKESGGHVTLLAVLFNCCEPEALTLALEGIRSDVDLVRMLADSDVLLGAYANSLTRVDPTWSLAESVEPQPLRTDMGPERYWRDYVRVWIDELGVQIVGGCCGITPDHISFIRSELEKRRSQ